MPAERAAIGMAPDEVREFLGRGRIMTVASIGAGGMGERGFTFGQILEHYYPGTQQCRLYA